MAQVTSPIILDSTGQQIHSDLQQIKTVLTTPSAAEDITFDNTGTGMQADDVQDAITELKSNLTDLLASECTFTPVTSPSSPVTSISGASMHRNGKNVYLHFTVQMSGRADSGITLGTVSPPPAEGFRMNFFQYNVNTASAPLSLVISGDTGSGVGNVSMLKGGSGTYECYLSYTTG